MIPGIIAGCRAGLTWCAVLLLAWQVSLSQCIIEKGPPPGGHLFQTGGVAPHEMDKNWVVAGDSATGDYFPAVVIDSLPASFYSSPDWISFADPGEHSGDRIFYFKRQFDLPCKNECDVSYNEPNTFCLSLTLYTDNSIVEIYINGQPQSSRLLNIPLADPYRPDSLRADTPQQIVLCNDWKAGSNELIIAVASSAPIVALLVMDGKKNPPQLPDTINAKICRGQNYEGYTEPGLYKMAYRGINGCDSVRFVQLEVQGPPHPWLDNQYAICPGDSIILFPGSFDAYTWQDGSTSPQFVVRQSGIYSVVVNNGCFTATAQTSVDNGICDVYFPNAFSPNGDGNNDRFFAVTNLLFSSFHLIIYNRWGQKVFECDDPHKWWDGTTNEARQPEGTYVWNCSYLRNGLLIRRKGSLLLHRN